MNNELFKIREELSESNEQFDIERNRLIASSEIEKNDFEHQLASKNVEIQSMRETVKTIQEEAFALKEINKNKFNILETKIKKYEAEISTNAESCRQKIKQDKRSL